MKLELYDVYNHIYLINGEKARINYEEIGHFLLPYLQNTTLVNDFFDDYDIAMHLTWYAISDNAPIECIFYSLETEKCWIIHLKIEMKKDKITIHTPFENVKSYETTLPGKYGDVKFGEDVSIKEVNFHYFLGREIGNFTIMNGIWLDSKIIYIDNDSIVCRNSHTKKAQTFWKQPNGEYLEDVVMEESGKTQKKKDRLAEIGKTILERFKK